MPTPITHLASLFGLKKRLAVAALRDLKRHVEADKKPARLVLDVEKVLAARALPEALEAAGFVVRVEKGDLTGLHWGPKPLPSDIAALKHLLKPLAKYARDPSVLIFKEANDREHDITLKKGKVTSNFYRGIEIGHISSAAHKANHDRKKGDKRRALELYEWLFELRPMSTPEYDRLEEHWLEASDELPELLTRFGRIEDAVDACARHRKPDSAVSYCVSLLDELQRPRDQQKFIALRLERVPDDDTCIFHLFSRAYDRSDYAEALAVLARATKERREAEREKESWCLYSLGRYSEALQIAKALAARADAEAGNHEHVGDVAAAMGDSAAAAAAWERAVAKSKPETGWDWASRSRPLVKLGRLAEARAAIDEALALPHSEQFTVQQALGILLLAEGDAAGAVKVLDAVVKGSPDVEHARWHLARALAAAGDRKRARSEARLAAKMSKDVARRLKADPTLSK